MEVKITLNAFLEKYRFARIGPFPCERSHIYIYIYIRVLFDFLKILSYTNQRKADNDHFGATDVKI